MYTDKELKSLQETAKKMGLKDVELGYGKCLKDGKVGDTCLSTEESSGCSCGKKGCKCGK